jgi:hypothetical protein
MRFIGEKRSMNDKIRDMGLSYRMTFLAYRPNSVVMSLGYVYDNLDSDLQAQDFTNFQVAEARKWLFDLFLADITLRKDADWIKGLHVMTWIDGRSLNKCSDDLRCDIESLVIQAHAAAQEQFDHV